MSNARSATTVHTTVDMPEKPRDCASATRRRPTVTLATPSPPGESCALATTPAGPLREAAAESALTPTGKRACAPAPDVCTPPALHPTRGLPWPAVPVAADQLSPGTPCRSR